ncbi:MAG: CHAT domain-containing protein [Leptolyngbyaceae cyanobacterium SM2_5_2]|nr:CHAT domain-containing protein [Leptolyngbyaceae cyanobacterium SM2_5_2]
MVRPTPGFSHPECLPNGHGQPGGRTWLAGFALQAGARSALASLWRVNDEATAGLMTLFYQQLDQQTTKAEALRQAQLALAQGNAYIENGVVYWPGGSLTLPTELAISDRQELRHPFYWAAFTMVGNPW